MNDLVLAWVVFAKLKYIGYKITDFLRLHILGIKILNFEHVALNILILCSLIASAVESNNGSKSVKTNNITGNYKL